MMDIFLGLLRPDRFFELPQVRGNCLIMKSVENLQILLRYQVKMLSTSMPPSAPRSTLEEMLESIKKRDERPKDIPPALPQRPTSKARLPSSVRTRKPISLPSPSLNPSTEAIHLNTSETRVSADSGFCTVESADQRGENTPVISN
eukprot:Gb_00903 [translate_table: standard]